MVDSDGNVRRRRATARGLRIGVTALAAAALVATSSSPAAALTQRVFSTTIGEPCARQPCGEGQLEEPDGVAVDEATGDVYVVDKGNDRVQEFNGSGAYLAQFNGSAAPTGGFSSPTEIAVDNSSSPLDPSAGDVYVVDAGNDVVDKFDSAGTYLGQVREVGGVAFESLDGVAVDPEGDLWVYSVSPETGAGEMSRFSDAPANEFLSTRESPFGASPGFAVDSHDDLYINRGSELVAELNEDAEVLIEAIDEEPSTAVAVDQASDEVYVDNATSVGVFAVGSGSASLIERFGSGRLASGSGIAVDSQTGTAYVADASAGQVFAGSDVVLPDVSTGAVSGVTETGATLTGAVDPDGVQVTSCEFEYGATTAYGSSAPCSQSPPEIGSGSSAVAVSATVTALAPGSVYHYRLTAANANSANPEATPRLGEDRTFTAPMHPRIEDESVAAVTSSAATLQARIDPGGSDTSYRFEYGPTDAYGSSVPVPAGDAGSGLTGDMVTVHPQGLQPDTTYHFRAVATNALGTATGADGTFTTQPTGRGYFSLPDGRAYEMVSPADKNDGGVFELGRSAPDGEQVAYVSGQAFADAQTGATQEQFYLASRGTGGWSSHALLPPQAPGCGATCRPTITTYSTDLSRAILLDGSPTGFNQDEPPLVAGEPRDNHNLFLRDNPTSSYELIDITPPGATPSAAVLQDASPNLGHVVFTEDAQLTPNAPSGLNLYEWSAGAVRLVSVLPNGAPVTGAEAIGAGDGNDHLLNAVSEDGTRIYFTVVTSGQHRALYLREGGTSTVQLDASQGPGGGGGGQFMTASSDGSTAYLTDDASAGLTDDTASGSGANLYAFNAASGALTDLTATPHAEVDGVLGASADGSYLYFVAGGVLTANAAPDGAAPVPGEPNLYLYHAGSTRFIGTLDPNDRLDWLASGEHSITARVTPDGRQLAFESVRSLTGYDNDRSGGGSCGVNTQAGQQALGERCTEVFEYSADTNTLACASCNPSGAQPQGPSFLGAASAPTPIFDTSNYLSRNLSEDGERLFFDSADPLVPGAANAEQNVYEYEQDGAGSCRDEGGCRYLISTGTSSESSYFVDASASGDDAFFITSQQLVPEDRDSQFDLYDARVGGGFPAPAGNPPCGGESCRPPASRAPAPAAPVATATPVGEASPTTTRVAPKERLLAAVVKGAEITIRVMAPLEGRISASGRGLRSAARKVPRAGIYTLILRLTANEKKQLEHRRKVKLTIRVGFFPTAGSASSLTVHTAVGR